MLEMYLISVSKDTGLLCCSPPYLMVLHARVALKRRGSMLGAWGE